MTRVALLGAESTGKTTLAQSLAAHFSTIFVPEFGRTFVEQHQRLPMFEEMLFMGKEQVRREVEALQHAHRFLFCDTTPLTTAVYSQYYFGKCDPDLQELATNHRYDLYFLTMPDIPWVADGIQRDGEAARTALHSIFIETLKQHGIPFIEVSGNLQVRLDTCCLHLAQF